MASLVGAIFDEYSTLNSYEKLKAVTFIGAATSFEHIIGPGLNLVGTPQNDVFLVDNTNTTINEGSAGGIDIAVSSVSYTLPSHVEHLILTGSGNLTGTGNTGDNVLAGNNGNNTLDGGSGSDLLLGGQGDDVLLSSSGSDTMCGGDGNDTIHGGTGGELLDGNAGNDVIDGGSGADTITGNSGDDIIFGGTSADSLSGGTGNDYLHGDAGADTIYGGSGNDTLTGGSSQDTFFFGNGDGTSIITDYNIGSDIIEVQAGVNGSSIDDVGDILATLGHDIDGNATFVLGTKTVTLIGIDEEDVTAVFHIV